MKTDVLCIKTDVNDIKKLIAKLMQNINDNVEKQHADITYTHKIKNIRNG